MDKTAWSWSDFKDAYKSSAKKIYYDNIINNKYVREVTDPLSAAGAALTDELAGTAGFVLKNWGADKSGEYLAAMHNNQDPRSISYKVKQWRENTAPTGIDRETWAKDRNDTSTAIADVTTRFGANVAELKLLGKALGKSPKAMMNSARRAGAFVNKVKAMPNVQRFKDIAVNNKYTNKAVDLFNKTKNSKPVRVGTEAANKFMVQPVHTRMTGMLDYVRTDPGLQKELGGVKRMTIKPFMWGFKHPLAATAITESVEAVPKILNAITPVNPARDHEAAMDARRSDDTSFFARAGGWAFNNLPQFFNPYALLKNLMFTRNPKYRDAKLTAAKNFQEPMLRALRHPLDIGYQQLGEELGKINPKDVLDFVTSPPDERLVKAKKWVQNKLENGEVGPFLHMPYTVTKNYTANAISPVSITPPVLPPKNPTLFALKKAPGNFGGPLKAILNSIIKYEDKLQSMRKGFNRTAPKDVRDVVMPVIDAYTNNGTMTLSDTIKKIMNDERIRAKFVNEEGDAIAALVTQSDVGEILREEGFDVPADIVESAFLWSNLPEHVRQRILVLARDR